MTVAIGDLVPDTDPDNAPFWAGLADGTIVVQQCLQCGRRRFPRLPGCPYCGAADWKDVTVAGTGTVYSWVRVHRPMTSHVSEGDVPYVIATVDLDGGGRMFGRLLDDNGAVAVGDRVGPVFVPHNGWTELAFSVEPAAAPARSTEPGTEVTR